MSSNKMDYSILLLLSLTVWSCCSGECPTGWASREDSCYLYFHEHYTFFEAKVACDIAQAHLVEIDSDAENTFIQKMVLHHNGGNMWMGMEDFIVEGQYMWAGSHTRPEFFKWAPGDPNNWQNNEDCVAMESGGGTWFDMDCERKYSFICETRASEGEPIGK